MKGNFRVVGTSCAESLDASERIRNSIHQNRLNNFTRRLMHTLRSAWSADSKTKRLIVCYLLCWVLYVVRCVVICYVLCVVGDLLCCVLYAMMCLWFFWCGY